MAFFLADSLKQEQNYMEALKRVRISRGALIHNFDCCRRQAGGAGIIALVKADAYGHGRLECARLFAALGASGLAVAEAVEGVQLREAGLELPIYVFAGVAPQTVAAIVAHLLVPVVGDLEMLRRFAQEAERQHRLLSVQLKLDVGMGRQGALPEDFFRLVREAVAMPSLRVSGLMAHLPKGDEHSAVHSHQMLEAFARLSTEARRLIPYHCELHLANSGGLLYVAGAHFDQVRPGLALYGYYPDGRSGREAASEPRLRPAMQWSATILQVRRLPPGHTVGYDCTYTTTRPTTTAVLPVGYADGYLRHLAGRGQVLIGGQRAPVLGRVSMNLSVVDVTHIAGVQAGDEAVLLGRQGQDVIDADELAGWMESISYEALCLIGQLNRREYIE